jgi:hypothetical protein
MPSLTFDGRSFMIDGRRIWLVSGSIPYARIPHENWADRIHAAKLAGLNTIETSVFWNRHEPRPGHFDFKGENDLRQFVKLCAAAGMYCILRVGPFIGQDWDFGGLPAWLLSVKNIKLRTMNGPFLEACSRYIGAVADQVRDLQITTPGKGAHAFHGAGGPIVMLQVESHWTCGDETAAAAYLGELGRYVRESGLNVPVINSNNLWAGAESELDGWTGTGDMLGTVRQLASVKPNQPRMIIEFGTGTPDTWGSESPDRTPPEVVERRLAQVLAAGGQFNIHPFCGGTNFAFWGGRRADAAAHSGGHADVKSGGFVCASADSGAPLRETGEPGPAFGAVRRICTFASRFSRLFGNLDPTFQPVAINPGEGAPKKSPMQTVVHASGNQGSVAFIFNDAGAAGSPSSGSLTLLTSDGTVLPVDVGAQGVSWCVFNVNLGGRSQLDYSGLSVFGLVGKALVVFGPAGSEGHLSINGTPLIVEVPKGKPHTIIEHEGMQVVVCSREQVDTVYLADEAVFVGVSGLTQSGHPLSLDGAKHCTRISADGEVKQILAVHPMATKRTEKIATSEWTSASPTDYTDGTSARFAAIDGAAELSTLGSPFGYGWYRLRIKSPAAGKIRLAAPHSGDRLHMYLDGELTGILGDAPGALPDLTLNLRKGTHTLVVLAENLGRLAGGADLGDSKGLYGDLWEIKPIRAGRAAVKDGDPIDPFTFRTPLWEVQPGDMTLSDRITWTILHKKKQQPIIVGIPSFAGRALLVVNNKPAAFIDRGLKSRITLGPDHLKGGANLIQLALLPDGGDAVKEHGQVLTEGVEFFEGVTALTAKAEWAFAKWEQPKAAAFKAPKAAPSKEAPAWWHSSFKLSDIHTPVFFDATGLTKGQLYINGRHLCRYFVSTRSGKAVPPQSVYMIPGPWLKPGENNDILIFDEHGASPARCRLMHEP